MVKIMLHTIRVRLGQYDLADPEPQEKEVLDDLVDCRYLLQNLLP